LKNPEPYLITVRDAYVDEVKNKWNLTEAITFNINETDYQNAGLFIKDYIKLNQSIDYIS